MKNRANTKVAGQLAIKGDPAALKSVSRKHCTIQVDEVTEGDGVSHVEEMYASEVDAKADIRNSGNRD